MEETEKTPALRCNPKIRLMLELMARGGMRVGEVLNLTPADIQERSLVIQNPKSGRAEETVYVPRKIMVRLTCYVRAQDIGQNNRILPISYVATWSMVRKAGKMVDIELRPHDLRRHAATYASRSGPPIEIVSKVILRHSDLSTTTLKRSGGLRLCMDRHVSTGEAGSSPSFGEQ